MSPFPALHVEANRRADERRDTARQISDAVSEWLAELDATLSDSSAGAGNKRSTSRKS